MNDMRTVAVNAIVTILLGIRGEIKYGGGGGGD